MLLTPHGLKISEVARFWAVTHLGIAGTADSIARSQLAFISCQLSPQFLETCFPRLKWVPRMCGRTQVFRASIWLLILT
jgi:hypothetical protein